MGQPLLFAHGCTEILTKLFISYAHVDRYRVEQLVKILREAGHDPWFDHKLWPGQDWQKELLNAVLASDIFVYAMTQHSIDSEWCQDVLVKYADARDIYVRG